MYLKKKIVLCRRFQEKIFILQIDKGRFQGEKIVYF